MRKKIASLLSVVALAIPLGLVSTPEANAAACYTTYKYISVVYAEASVNYGSCKVGSTRSVAHVNFTLDSGWYEGSTRAESSGFNALPNGAYANYYTSGLR